MGGQLCCQSPPSSTDSLVKSIPQDDNELMLPMSPCRLDENQNLQTVIARTSPVGDERSPPSQDPLFSSIIVELAQAKADGPEKQGEMSNDALAEAPPATQAEAAASPREIAAAESAVSSDKNGAHSTKTSAHSSVSVIRTQEQTVFLRETIGMASSTPVPEQPSECKSLGWRDISKPSSKVYYKHTAKPSRDSVRIIIKTQDQVPRLPLLTMQNGKILDGLIPTLWVVRCWNLWFPFCESTQVLRRFSPDCFIVIVKLKVLFLAIDFISFVSIEDKLAIDGHIELVMRSPPTGSEGQTWMGITVPPKAGMLPRACVNYAVVKARPTGEDEMELDGLLQLDDPAGAPQWVKVFFFQQLAIRVLPELLKFQSKIPGSALDKYLNERGGDDCIDPESWEFIQNLYASISSFLELRT